MTPVRYVLDTDLFTLYREGVEPISSRITAASGLFVSVITIEEVLSGWYSLLRQSTHRERLEFAYDQLGRTAAALGRLPILTYDCRAMDAYDRLKSLKTGVKKPDLRIAAIALVNSAAVVTRNARDFTRVPGLAAEDWSVP